MIENNCNRQFSEAVCVDAMRVFDSCSAQDCLEDLEFVFTEEDQETINGAAYIKTKEITITGVTFTIDPVPFNKGFYTVEITYAFRAEVDVYNADDPLPETVYGTATFSKKVILYGSEGSTQRFVSNEVNALPAASTTSGCACNCDCGSVPVASVNVAAPMCLDAKLVPSTTEEGVQNVFITIGIFAIVQLSRPVPILIPSYDYCVPGKECSSNTDTPCELFEALQFPTNEFFPRGIDKGCCQSDDNDNDGDNDGNNNNDRGNTAPNNEHGQNNRR
ncbi:MAG: hypothetical protein IJ740_02660 [Ruminococcus sp.]|nr:hypothetical protein [Ruminococcus sp.]